MLTKFPTLVYARLVDWTKYMKGYILKEAADIMPVQNSLDSSVNPEDWHTANITPLFK